MKSNKDFWLSLGLLTIISALSYLPLIHRFGYFNDDWYSMYDAQTQGSQFFHTVFGIDRPGRAYLMIPLYRLFGPDPLLYNISAYFFRLLGGASLLWTVNLLWPQKKLLAVTTAILFTIYPGFLSQYNAIDYQSHIFALSIALLSALLTIKAVQAVELKYRVGWTVLSVLLGWGYLSQMEYYIGFEAFRIACIGLLVWRSLPPALSLVAKLRNTLIAWLPFALIPAGFLFWRIFLFDVERRSTDIGAQVGQLFTSPLTGLWWLVYTLQDLFSLLIGAWVIPVYLYVFSMRLKNLIIGILLAVLTATLFALFNRQADEHESGAGAVSNPRETREVFWIGIIATFGGLFPVIAVNRHIILPDYSRYSLIASIGAVLLLVVFIERSLSHSWRIGASCFLIAIAFLVHYANSVKAATETESMRSFWWQVAWRAPDIQPGVTLIASYPVVAIQEDYFVWGPANLIYHPEKQNTDPIIIKLPAAVLTGDVITGILTGQGEESPLRRGNYLTRNFENIVILTQSKENSCVRIIDGNAPELSIFDQERIMLIASHSNLDSISTQGESPIPPVSVFGNEPAHEWCYFYEKADLARQQGDWETVVQLGNEAQRLDLHPSDQIEWLPFLQAYVLAGDQKQVKILSTRINTESFYRQQTCRVLSDMTEMGHLISPEMQTQVNELFCQ